MTEDAGHDAPGTEWWYAFGSERKGPVSSEELDVLARAGVVGRDTLVWREGREGWSPARDVPELSEFVRTAAPPIPPVPTEVPRRWSSTGGDWAAADPNAWDEDVASFETGSFTKLYTWYWICMGPGLLLCFPLIVGTVLGCIINYRLWALLQKGGGARTSPGLAVGLSFVPIFGLYWNFVALYGLAQDMNDLCKRRRIAVRVDETRALTVCILLCAGLIPYLGLLAILVGVVLNILLHGEFCRAAEVILADRRKPR